MIANKNNKRLRFFVVCWALNAVQTPEPWILSQMGQGFVDLGDAKLFFDFWSILRMLVDPYVTAKQYKPYHYCPKSNLSIEIHFFAL